MADDVGVLGGSFDPVHAGHIAVGRRALEQIPLDEVWFVPATSPPHKPEGPTASPKHRRAMLELALGAEPCMKVCAIEMEAQGPRYTVDTLRALRARHPRVRWWLLLGEDSFRAIDAWREPQRLLELALPVVCPRPGSSGERVRQRGPTPVRWLEGEGIELSSTTIRAQLRAGERPGGLPDPVYEYICAHGLYGEKSER
jgi:nicotinate-nucleotide adenylyltransferase